MVGGGCMTVPGPHKVLRLLLLLSLGQTKQREAHLSPSTTPFPRPRAAPSTRTRGFPRMLQAGGAGAQRTGRGPHFLPFVHVGLRMPHITPGGAPAVAGACGVQGRVRSRGGRGATGT